MFPDAMSIMWCKKCHRLQTYRSNARGTTGDTCRHTDADWRQLA